MVEIEGEAMRGVTWVRVKEVRSGQWGSVEAHPVRQTSKRWRPANLAAVGARASTAATRRKSARSTRRYRELISEAGMCAAAT